MFIYSSRVFNYFTNLSSYKGYSIYHKGRCSGSTYSGFGSNNGIRSAIFKDSTGIKLGFVSGLGSIQNFN